MQTLLIVLLIGCALVAVVHIGRGMWARSRSVERHRQALHTLATFTTPLEATPGAHTETGDHQAHVRVIGSNGSSAAGAPGTLPPPLGVTRPGPERTSAFRRPSHLEPSLAALDAVATSTVRVAGGLPRSRRGGPPPPPVPRPDGDDATLPGIPPVARRRRAHHEACARRAAPSLLLRRCCPGQSAKAPPGASSRRGPGARGGPRRPRCSRLPTGGHQPDGGRERHRGPAPTVARPAALGDSGGLGGGGGGGPGG